MKLLNNIEFANIAVLQLKEDLEINPYAGLIDFKINTDSLSEQFNEIVFKNIICTELNCILEIIEYDKGFYHITGELNSKTTSKKNINGPYIIDEVTSNLYIDSHNKFDDYIIKGLKRKGFVFYHLAELEQFAKKRIRVEDNTIDKERIFYVDDMPFFLHKYETQMMDIDTIVDINGNISISANLGSFSFL